MVRAALPIGSDARSFATTLASYRYGRFDPTTRLGPGELWRASLTPDGPGTVRITWTGDDHSVSSWGPGGPWLEARAPALLGALDVPVPFTEGHPAVLRAQHNHPGLRLGASGNLYHELLPNIIGQRITGGEAIAQWHRLVRSLGEPAPGPHPELRTPPEPQVLAHRPAWWFHPLGIEAKRAEALRQVARHADRLWQWAELPAAECAAKLSLLRGIGPWTIGSAVGPALGDPDAVAVGDFHLKNIVTHALSGQPRGTDERMLELLEPYAGQRGRVVRLLLLDGHRAPAFGPRQRILPMARW